MLLLFSLTAFPHFCRFPSNFFCATFTIETLANLKLFSGGSLHPVARTNSQNFKLFLPRPYEKSTAAPPPFSRHAPIFPPGRRGKRKICQRVVYLRAHNDSLAKELAAVTAWGEEGVEKLGQGWENQGRWWGGLALHQE